MRVIGIHKGMGRAFLSAVLIGMMSEGAFAALPFITDDSGTLGKGTSQVELSYERVSDKETVDGSTMKTYGNQIAATFGHGIAEKLDLALGLARPWGKVDLDGFSLYDAGSADFTLNAKWQFFDKSGISFAVKPQAGYSYLVGRTSDDHTVSYGGWLIATKEHEPLVVSFNVGYFYNDYGSAADRVASRSSIWSVSALMTYEVLKGLKLGCDVGASTNEDKAYSEMPVYALAGAIYSMNQNIDLSLGLKIGITKPEPDFSGIAGVTIKY